MYSLQLGLGQCSVTATSVLARLGILYTYVNIRRDICLVCLSLLTLCCVFVGREREREREGRRERGKERERDLSKSHRSSAFRPDIYSDIYKYISVSISPILT